MPVIFETSCEELRRWLRGPPGHAGVVTNIVRLCSRRPFTLPELAGFSLESEEAVGLPKAHWGFLSEINVTVVIGELKHRDLLVRMRHAANEEASRGPHEKLRTSLLAFLLCPELAVLEPAAFNPYLSAAFTHPISKECFLQQLQARRGEIQIADGELLYDWQMHILLAFPALMQYGFAVFSERTDLGEVPGASAIDRQRIFGYYHIAGLPVIREELSQSWWQRTYHLRKGFQLVIPGHLSLLRSFLQRNEARLQPIFDHWPKSASAGLFMALLKKKKVRKLDAHLDTQRGGEIRPIEIATVEEPVLLQDRLGPIPLRWLF